MKTDERGTLIGLIRGINVGRAKRVSMADLRALVAGLGHTEVRTLLNSGNVVFSTPGGVAPAAAGLPADEVVAGNPLSLKEFIRPYLEALR
ncbi:MAG: DUF1697 domain-containing protein [Thermoleophilia bacterium]